MKKVWHNPQRLPHKNKHSNKFVLSTEIPSTETIESRLKYSFAQEKFKKPFEWCNQDERLVIFQLIRQRDKAAWDTFDHSYYFCSDTEQKSIKLRYP